MQVKQTLSKEELKAWKAQLQVTHITEQNLEEALTLVVDSTVQLSQIFRELEISRETCFEMFRPDFEDKLNQKNSILITDPSANNKVIGLRIFRDMVHIDQTAPKRENFQCERQYLKSQLNHELMQGIYEKKFEEKDYEISPIFNVHPDYASMGLSELMVGKYVEHAYRRGVKKLVNIMYNHIMVKMSFKYKQANPTTLKEISLEDREIDGKKIFNEVKNGYIVSQDVNDESMVALGLSKLVELKKQNQLNFDEKEFYDY